MTATVNITIPDEMIREAVRKALRRMGAEPPSYDSYVIRYEGSTGRLLLEGPGEWFAAYPRNTPVSVGVIMKDIAEHAAREAAT